MDLIMGVHRSGMDPCRYYDQFQNSASANGWPPGLMLPRNPVEGGNKGKWDEQSYIP
jgi:hypothetical protein